MRKLLLSLALLLATTPAFAFTNTGEELELLTFGQGIITDNSAARSCVVTAEGSESCDAEIILLNPGRYGVFRLSDFDPTVAIWATVDDSATTLDGPGGTAFDVKNFTFNPNINDIGTAVTPNADGTLLLQIGATLKTRAGTTYDVTPYRGTYTLQINY